MQIDKAIQEFKKELKKALPGFYVWIVVPTVIVLVTLKVCGYVQ